jgi:hypothetical protein
VQTRVWRASTQEGFGHTFDVDGYVDALTFATYEGLRKLVGPKNSHSGGCAPVVNEGGSRYFSHTVTVRAIDSTPDDDAVLEEWLASDAPIILETNNKEFFLYGADNGMTASSEGGQNTGQNFEGTELPFTYTLNGAEQRKPFRIWAGTYEATLALLQSYEL